MARGAIRRRRRIAILTLLALTAVGVFWFFRPGQIRVIGSLPPNDLQEIQKLVWHEVRRTELPTFEWDSVRYPRYFFGGITRYARLRVLWIEVKDSRYVRVVVGLNTNTVASDGFDFMVQKNQAGEHWEITGSAYWGVVGAAPPDFRIPP